MEVLKQTSPQAWARAPKPRPGKTEPSSRAKIAFIKSIRRLRNVGRLEEPSRQIKKARPFRLRLEIKLEQRIISSSPHPAWRSWPPDRQPGNPSAARQPFHLASTQLGWGNRPHYTSFATPYWRPSMRPTVVFAMENPPRPAQGFSLRSRQTRIWKRFRHRAF